MKSESEINELKSELETETSNTVKFSIISYLKHISHKYIAIIVFLILWQVIPSLNPIWAMYIMTPSVIAMTMWSLTLSGVLPAQTAITLSRVFIGFGIALLVAIPLGYLLGGFFKDFEKAVDPLLQLLGQLNPWSFFHIAIVFLGIGELSIISVVCYISLWPVLYNTVTGTKNVDNVLVKVGRAAGMGKFDIFWKVQLPASLPTVFAGMRLGAILAFFMVIGAEMMGAGDGLGYMIMQAQMYTEFLVPRMWAGIVTASLLGMAFVYVLLQLEKYFTRWNENINF